MEAIILSGDTKHALVAVRSLGQRGIRVSVGAERSTSMAFYSKYAARTFVYRSPLTDQQGFLSDVLKEAQICAELPVLFTFSDATHLALARNRAAWEGKLLLPLASAEHTETAFDKSKSVALAAGLGIAVPLTRTVTKESDAEALFAECGSVPVVVKPRHTASWAAATAAKGSVEFAFSARELKHIADGMRERFGEDPLVEAYLSGGEYGYDCLCKDGRVLAYSAHRRIRSFNPTGGAAVVMETIELDPKMKADSEKLLAALSWTGPAMVEWKRAADGTYHFLEVNGRFWGSLPVAVFAGTDFPYLYFRLARGETLQTEPDTYIRGVRVRHVLADAHNLVKTLFANDPMRRVAYPSRLRALLTFFTPTLGMRSAIFSISDPAPFFMEFVDHLFFA